MNGKIVWLLLRQSRKVWVRVVGFAALAVLTAALAQLASRFIPEVWTERIGAEAVDQVLTILATSMLAVTTFSLSIAVSAFAAAARTATPRATALLQEDTTTQNVLATFLGAFLFSLVGIIAQQAGYYSDPGLVVLFVMTGLVVGLVVVALLRWISHLMSFGRMANTLDRVELTARQSLQRRLDNPFLGGTPFDERLPDGSVPVLAKDTGYVQHVDVAKLAKHAQEAGTDVWLTSLPGAFAHPARPLVCVERDVDEDAAARFRATFTLAPERSFDQDPRFGLIVLSEIASRALSPAVNDPGTAISVIGRLVRILGVWTETPEPKVEHPSVHVPRVDPADMITDAFRPIARDGADNVEVQLRLQKALQALALLSPAVFGPSATAMAGDARARAAERLTPDELAQVRDAAAVTGNEPSPA